MTAAATALHVPIRHEVDVAIACKRATDVARQAGLPPQATAALATAVSEVARNIFQHARRGEVLLAVCEDGARRGVAVVARDEGPGIPHLDRALQDGFSTARTLGLGLPSARRLVDDFEIESIVGRGTTVTMRKWADAQR
jgi:serine/threonine-protein kinase RsbT